MNRDTAIIQRPLPNAVKYDLSTPGHVTITLPPASTWSSGLHWHESHDEYLKVVKGSIHVRLGNAWSVIKATESEQPEIKVNRYVWHEWKRAESSGEVVVIERTDPADDDKALFFWNLNGVILSVPKLLEHQSSFLSQLPAASKPWVLDIWITLQLFVIFAHLDNFPVFVNLNGVVSGRISGGVNWVVTHFVLYLSSWLGWLFRLQPVNIEFTPQGIYTSWVKNKSKLE